MPTLDWIGKKAVVNHHQEVPFHLLRDVPELGCGPADSGNLIVEGDNLTSLKALLPYYAGQVKCIYIDPPYNTGNESWVYNDNTNSPEIKAWLGKVVGKEAEDLSRHDKWLCMMYPRLKLLREFLREDGAIFISLDDNEIQSLRFIMDEIFGRQNFVATVIWQKMDSPKNTAIHLSEDHDYIVIYAKAAKGWRPNKLPRTEAMTARYKNPDNDPRGPWLLSDLAARNFYSAGRYPITTPTGRVIDGPPAGSYWRVSREKFDELDRDGRIWWGKNGSNRPGTKRFLSEVQVGVVPQTLWMWKDVGSTRHSKQEVSEIMAMGASQDLFITPKPTSLIERVLQIASGPGDLVMDSFAGSGTTGHAVLKLNAAQPDQPPRRFILAEIDPKIARPVTAERVKRIGLGYTNAKGETVAGLGGGFRYVQLGEPLFDAAGKIRPTVRFRDLARHVFFTETGTPLPHDAPCDKPLLGVAHGTGVYLLYNGILKDKSPDGGNVLTLPILTLLPPHEGPRVIYGTACRISPQRLKTLGIVFKQTPYAIKVR
jgi:site-specific DNA-methyltransferase (adenine-specific)/adenine-specific DNA-methyltransferase